MNGHYYDWKQKPPYTDNPRHVGKLEPGLHNKVYVNGVDAGAAVRFQTGENGWVERYAKDQDGRLVEEPEGELKRETLRGFVVFVIDKVTPSPLT